MIRLARLGVEPGRRLVEDQHGRVADHRPRDRDPLALAAREPAALLPDRASRSRRAGRAMNSCASAALAAASTCVARSRRGGRRRCSRGSCRRRRAVSWSSSAMLSRTELEASASRRSLAVEQDPARSAGRRSGAAASPASTCRRRSARPAPASRRARARTRRLETASRSVSGIAEGDVVEFEPAPARPSLTALGDVDHRGPLVEHLDDALGGGRGGVDPVDQPAHARGPGCRAASGRS